MNCGWKGGDCGDVDAEAASWRPPTLADERHDDGHLRLLLHTRTISESIGNRACCTSSLKFAECCQHHSN